MLSIFDEFFKSYTNPNFLERLEERAGKKMAQNRGDWFDLEITTWKGNSGRSRGYRKVALPEILVRIL